ncbi:hypothetical protein HN51_046038 [Arachis hypogaea]
MGVFDSIGEVCEEWCGIQHKIRKLKQIQGVEIKVKMDCEGCERRVKKSVEGMKGVTEVEVEPKQSKLTVKGYVDPEKVLERVLMTRRLRLGTSGTPPPSAMRTPMLALLCDVSWLFNAVSGDYRVSVRTKTENVTVLDGCNLSGSHRGGGNAIAGGRVAAVDEMATATVVDHAMSVVVAVGAQIAGRQNGREVIVAAPEASINGLGAMMLYSLLIVREGKIKLATENSWATPARRKKKIISPQKQGGEETMMAVLNVIIEREGRNWRKKVVVQVHILPCKAFSGMVVLLMVLGSVVPQIRIGSINTAIPILTLCLHCHTLLWHIFWGALKHANGIEGRSTIVVRVIACFQPLHNCQEKPMTALGEQVCQSVVIMLERLCTANHSLYAVCMPSICANLSMSMTGRMGTSTVPRPFTVFTILHSYVATILKTLAL